MATAVALAGGWAAFILVGNSWWQLAVAVFLAAVFTQDGFLGHDAGHRQVFRSGRASYVTGLLHGNLGIGLSYGWWVAKHNRHHAHPSTENADPGIAASALAFTADQARASRGVARLAYRYQAYLFPAAADGSAPPARGQHPRPDRPAQQAPGLGGSAADRSHDRLSHRALPGALPGQGRGVRPGAAGPVRPVPGLLLRPQPQRNAHPAADDQSDFLRRQVLTSRNVNGGLLTDFALGGLNYQIEHHLFPSMPRPNLRRAQTLVAVFCQQQGLPYCHSSLASSYVQALRHLNANGKMTRPQPTAATPMAHS